MTFLSGKQSVALLLKVILFGLSLWFIYYRVIERENSTDVIRDIKQISSDSNSLLLLFTAMILMLVNWSIEALKWKYLIKKITAVSFFVSLSSVLSGVTFSLFTPNRIGEFAGRILHLPQGTRIKAALATVLGNIAQLAVTIFTGSLAGIYYLQYFELNSWLRVFVLISLVVINLLFILCFFNIRVIERWLLKFKFLKSYTSYLDAIGNYSRKELINILFLSAARYCVFASQYVLILKAMQVETSWQLLYIPVAMVFVVVTVVPTIALTELALRTSVAVAVIGLVSGNALGILEASFMVWFINLIIPSLAGSFTLFALKLFKNE